jgi:vancomycin resistance protein YoaR
MRLSSVLRWISCMLVLGALTLGPAWAWRTVVPADGVVAQGLRVGGSPVAAAASPRAAAEAAAEGMLRRRVTLRYGSDTLGDVTAKELGGSVDLDHLERDIASVGHKGGWATRLVMALGARRGEVEVPVRLSLPVEPLAHRLERYKDEHDTRPKAARLDLAAHTASAHEAGRYLDVYAAVATVHHALQSALAVAEVPPYLEAPRATTEAVLRIDASTVVSQYETRFGFAGGQAGRAQNIARAAEQIRGVVLMPGDLLSFNDIVGPRTEDNGFATAPEIYKGEMRDGVGGGTCQVSGTLHAAALFGGVDILQRSNHSRPSGYIGLGLDATVVYPDVDLKLKNPYDFPLVVHTRVDRGVLRIELRGRERPADVQLSTETIGVAAFKRKVEEAAWLDAGEIKLKQRGIRGISIRKTRRIHVHAGVGARERVEVTTDVYPPTLEIYVVSPGADLESLLPPTPVEPG